MSKLINYLNNETYDCYINESKRYEIDLNECGYERCSPSHYWSGRKNFFVFHYVLNGKGIVKINDGENLMAKKGSIFFISPYDGAYYEADEKEPWEYIWIGFSGISAKSIMYNSTLMVEYVQRVRNEKALLSIYRNIVTNSRKGDVAYLLVLSELYKFMAYLLKNYGTDKRCKELSIKEQNFRKILKMIDANCFSKIKTAQLAQVVGYEKTYVYRLFQEFVGISPQKYINYLRIMNVVQTINVEPNKNIEDLVFEAGFEEYSTFYRIFKQYVGCSPIEYKENFKNYNSENLQIKHMDELLTRIRNFKK